MVFGQRNQLFPRKKMVLGRKTSFFSGKTKKPSFGKLCGQTPKRFFFGFPRKKMVLGRKTNFFLGKRWFWAEKPTFS